MVMKSIKKTAGFTIVELLIVIVVIAILAAISVVAYNGIQERARGTKITQDLASLQKAIMLARETTGKTLFAITGNGYTANSCIAKAAGTDLAVLAKTDACWVNYTTALSKISEAGGADVRNIVDPWGRPYALDENEGEWGNCGKDTLAVYTNPFKDNNQTTVSKSRLIIPLSGYSGCSTT